MGFLDKLTGGGATIQLSLQKNEFAVGEQINAWITVTANSNIKAEAIVLHLFGVEQVRLNQNCQRCGNHINVPAQTIYNNEINIAGPQQMHQGEVRQFQGAIPIPHGVPPTYRGRSAETKWYLEARVSMFGNDPDTKLDIVVR